MLLYCTRQSDKTCLLLACCCCSSTVCDNPAELALVRGSSSGLLFHWLVVPTAIARLVVFGLLRADCIWLYSHNGCWRFSSERCGLNCEAIHRCWRCLLVDGVVAQGRRYTWRLRVVDGRRRAVELSVQVKLLGRRLGSGKLQYGSADVNQRRLNGLRIG